MGAPEKDLQCWNELNARQQQYLECIYRADQTAEHDEKQCWLEGRERRPANVWRWLLYGDIALNRGSPLKERLKKANLVDTGTGSTFRALKKRKLIECRWSYPSSSIEWSTVDIQLTRLGRRVARVGLNEPVEHRTKTPKGMLTEKGWQALALVCSTNGGSVPADSWYYYGSINLNVWERLELERPALVKITLDKVCATLAGHKFYVEQYLLYCSTYPDVEAPKPIASEAVLNKAQRDNHWQERFQALHEGKRLKEIAAQIDPWQMFVTATTLSRFVHGKTVEPQKHILIINWIIRTEAVQEVQVLLDQLSETYPTDTAPQKTAFTK